MSALYESCAGCGAETPSERCFGCFHDFGPGLTATSNANTSGLEVVAWRSTWVGHTGKTCHAYHQDRQEADDNAEHMSGASEPLVTAASAQEMIDAAKARADRLAKAGDRLIDALHRYGFPVSGGARVALTDRGSNEAVELDEAASLFRAALQQETQK